MTRDRSMARDLSRARDRTRTVTKLLTQFCSRQHQHYAMYFNVHFIFKMGKIHQKMAPLRSAHFLMRISPF